MTALKELLKIAVVFVVMASLICLHQWRRNWLADEERYRFSPRASVYKLKKGWKISPAIRNENSDLVSIWEYKNDGGSMLINSFCVMLP